MPKTAAPGIKSMSASDAINAPNSRDDHKWQVVFVSIDSDTAGQRLDNFLLNQWRGVPKSHVYRLIRSGEVRVNKKRSDAAYRLSDGDLLRLPPVRIERNSQTAIDQYAVQQIHLPIVYEDEALLVINKPAGIAVHGGSGLSFGVIEILRQQYPEYRHLELAHRLDRDTSGLLILCKKRSALRVLHTYFRPQPEKPIDKRYLLLAQGRVLQPQFKLEWSLTKTLNAKGERHVVVDANGKTAVTGIRLMKRWQSASLLTARLFTGRTHQIRVHLAQAGHPILGDERYGNFELNRQMRKNGFENMMLHAASLRLTHPLSGQILQLNAPPPPSFVAMLAHLDQQETVEYQSNYTDS